MYTLNGQLTEAIQYSTASTGETSSLVTGSSPIPFGAKLLGLIVSNVSGTAGWAQVFDGYATPSNSAVPLLNIQVASGAQNSLDCGVFNCLKVKNGIVVVLSSTINTYTPISSGLVTFAAFIT